MIKLEDSNMNFLEDLQADPKFAYYDITNGQSKSRRKFLLIQIRVNSFFDNLLEASASPKVFPPPIVQFFAQFFASK